MNDTADSLQYHVNEVRNGSVEPRCNLPVAATDCEIIDLVFITSIPIKPEDEINTRISHASTSADELIVRVDIADPPQIRTINKEIDTMTHALLRQKK